MGWLHQRLLDSAPGGAEDVDAYLAGRPLPSVQRARESRRGSVLELGGEVTGADR